MQPITANSIALTHMRGPTIPGAAESKSKASVSTDELPAPPPKSPDVSSTPSHARVKLTADDLAALQAVASDIPAGTPAEEARAAVAANPDLGNVPFGRLVSQFARGDITLDSNTGNESTSSETSDQSSGSVGDIATAGTTDVDTSQPQTSSISGGDSGANDLLGSDTSSTNDIDPSQSAGSDTAANGNTSSDGTDPGTIDNDAADTSTLSAALSDSPTSTSADLVSSIDPNVIDAPSSAV